MASNILGDLANAAKALSAQRFGVTTAGNNLANVNNPDYSRQRIVLGEDGVVQTLYGPRGLGVEVQGFEQMRDVVLDREVLRETSLNASLEAQQAALQKAQANVGQEITRSGDSPFIDGATADGGGSGGIAEVINNFFNSLHALSADPAADAEKEAMMQKAQILVEKLNVTSERFSDLQEDLSLQVTTDLGQANQFIDQIARLNAEIARAEANHAGQALSLRDQRQATLEKLSKIIQFKTENIDNTGGQIRVFIPTIGGDTPTIDLVNLGRSKHIEFDDSGLNPKFTIKGQDTQVEIRGGSIHGSLLARDGTIAEYLRGLNDMAGAMVTQVNAIYSAGGTDTNFFADDNPPASRTAANIALDPTLSTATFRTSNVSSDQGDNTTVLALAELDETRLASLGNRTISSFYRSHVSNLGETIAKTQSRLDDENIVFRLLKEQQDGVSGVSIDEEMTDMMKYQRAYEATGKLIKAIDEMLDVIVNRLI